MEIPLLDNQPAAISRATSPPGAAAGGMNKQAADGREDLSMRSTRIFTMLVAVALSAASFSGKVLAAGYPERPIELIVPWGPGGGADQLPRLVWNVMEPVLGQGMPGGDGPDGHG